MFIGICEDDETILEYLKLEVEKYYQQTNKKINIETFLNAEQLLFNYPKDLPFDCLILDIILKDMNGMELAKKVRQTDEQIQIIFVTGDKDFVFEGYKVGAVRYLLKPIKTFELIEALKQADRESLKQSNNKKDYFCFDFSGDFVKLKKSNIIYIMVEGHYLTVKTMDRQYTYKGTIRHIKEKLDDDRFVLANRSVILNLDNVEQIEGKECVMSNGEKISISRGNYSKLNEQFIEYYK